MGPLQAPWTEVGRLQSDISEIKSALGRKVEQHELSAIHRRLDSLESSIGAISTALDGLRSRCEAMEENRITQT